MNRLTIFACRAAASAVVALSLTTLAARAEAPAPVLAPLSPEAAAISAAFAPEGEVFAAYEARGFAPIWLGENGPSAAATAYLEALGQADRHALPVERYGREELRARLADLRDLDLAARAALEADLTASFLAYARDLNSGALVPRKVDRELHVYPERPEPHTLITGLGDATDPARWLAELAPQDPVYARLVARYETYRMLADGAAWGESLPKRRTLREGERSDLVPLLRDRLTAMGYLEDDRQVQGTLLIASNETANDAENGLVEEAVDPNRYDPALVAAVTQFQARHGLNQDGVVGPATRAALNVEPGFRAAQIAVNLERMRWLNRDLGAKHILVNLAAFEFDVLEDGKSVFNSRTVVGKARKHRTPEFSDEMDHMVINPTWFVPRSIAREEILPALQEDPTYLSRKNMRITGVDDPSTIDWSTITPDTFPGKVRQAPGSGNALGRVKFMFPNDHAIYLHDTPAKSLFKRDSRAYSHGCVRVQRPFEFAEYLLSAQEEDPAGTFDRILRSERERYVYLEQPIPVHITYRTFWVDAAGEDQFRGDVYGRDSRVLAALAKAGVDLPAH